MASLSEITKMADRPLNELLTHDLVDIYVGPLSTHWILHEKLLCARSLFFRRAFYTSHKRTSTSTPSKSPRSQTPSSTTHDQDKPPSPPPSTTKTLYLPTDDTTAFQTLTSWLYSATIPHPRSESDLTPLFDLYLMGTKWGMPTLTVQALEAVRSWYADNGTYPSLRRVQYVCAGTEPGDAMRGFVVGCVARGLALGEVGGLPGHWERALRRDGGLGVEVLLCVRGWGVKGVDVPDLRRGDGGVVKGEKEQEKEEKELKKEENKEENEEEEQEEEEKAEDEDGQAFNMKALNKELPNGLVNGHAE
ncbi:hypothetical protein EJ05DRAFT_503487 [Pseudovirgaria hyperparasitica]|uniref:BTB domain-containing protein n=1 Tax=Pseudovirgaria hyperparasitica TaxID=470096 RepID=A0A6A6VX57_9PEZI|nr:uncharacterized protein EJ05DRAFT_503487 [Pseudovirgaria hyperparasitica]KAF2755182.1 hypothetical protein EJ05DRAFT_503487 [Pseudovirgaria hyperparasitica]